MEQRKQTILVTGGAGFIGSNLVDHLLAKGNYRVIALDNFDPYYPRAIKEQNIAQARKSPDFELIEADITKKDDLEKVGHSIDAIVHLAAKAGVRPSIDNPTDYFTTNVNGTVNLLEFARARGIHQFVFASSSSVYGEHPARPWGEDIGDLNPISPYAVSKLAAEKLGFVYAQLHKIRFIAMRLFSVYGNRQRPDLALAKFAHLIRCGKNIGIYGHGTSARDYTYVEDVVEYLTRAIHYTDSIYELLNVGSGKPCTIWDLVCEVSRQMNVDPSITFHETQQGDVSATSASISKIESKLGGIDRTPLAKGISRYLSVVTAGSRTHQPTDPSVDSVGFGGDRG
jgi:UDP-glucuronate 4-epimerase